ncbi:MAG: DUF2846 domain-containing protein [bacterium]|nr:DUF2846 domain-containing protein [bacterium]
MRKLSVGVVTTCLFGVLGLAVAAHAAEYYNKLDKSDQRRGEPREGHAPVYVFRPATVGAAIKTWAFSDDSLLMVSKPRAYSFANVPAGKRLFWTKSENTSAVEVEVEAGQTYYLKVAIKPGFNKARAKILQIDEGAAEKYFQKCSYVEPTEEGLARAVEIVANRKDRAVNKAAKQE